MKKLVGSSTLGQTVKGIRFRVQCLRYTRYLRTLLFGQNAPTIAVFQEGDTGIHAAWESCKQWKANCKECTICTREFAQTHGVSVPIYHCELSTTRASLGSPAFSQMLH